MHSLVPAPPAWLATLEEQLSFRWASEGERRIRITGASGSGKTVVESMLAWFDWHECQLPTIVLDPHGTLVDLLLGYIILEDPRKQPALWQRVKYVDVGSREYISPMPLYYRRGTESLFEIANRYPEAIRRIRPQLEAGAPIMGMPAITRLNDVGMFLAATGRQINEAEDIIRNPQAYKTDILRAQQAYPDELAETTKKLLDDFPKPKTWEYETLRRVF